LAVAIEDQKRGMLLYNLGRIAEERGQTDTAIEHYRESLRARPNDTVAARLTKLAPDATMVAAAPAADDHAGLAVLGSGLASIEAVCELASRESMCSGEDCELVATPDGDESWGVLSFADVGFMGCWHPLLKTSTGWVLLENALLGQHGSEIDQDVDAIASRVVKNDAGEFLLIEYSDHTYERNWYGIDLEDEDAEFPPQDMIDSEGVIICRREGDGARCTPPITTDYKYTDTDEKRARYSADLDLRGDTIVISNVQREGERLGYSSELSLLDAGEYPFAELAAPRKR
jgi:hypothetical protein